MTPDGATIAVSGALTLDRNGIYRKDAAAAEPTDACLTAGSVLITNSLASDCVEGPCRGEMILTDFMAVTATGDFVLSESTACRSLSLRGGCMPPSLRIGDSANLLVGGSLILSGNVDVGVGSSGGSSLAAFSPPPLERLGHPLVEGMGHEPLAARGGCTPPSLRIGALTPPSVMLQGDFDNQSTTPVTFDWTNGSLLLTGTSQTFEVAGADLGVTPDGFVNNFAMGTVEVVPEPASTAAVTFVDNRINTTGDEALYVSQLILPSTSTITIDGVNIYYEQLVDGGATIILINGGALVDVSCVDSTDCNDGNVCTAGQCVGNICSFPLNTYGDVNCDPEGAINIFDLLCVLQCFAGDCSCCCINVCDINPCPGNETINIFDLLAVLGAFAGNDLCCDGLP